MKKYMLLLSTACQKILKKLAFLSWPQYAKAPALCRTACAASLLIITNTGALLFPATGAADRLKSYEKHLEMKNKSIFKQLKWENLGPYSTGGRLSDIEAYENDPYKFLVASASGGLWLTRDNATTWEALFDRESSIAIGDIAVSQDNDKLIWIGTGEANSSQSSYAGTGVFKSSDGGKTWENMGLHESHHIGRIIIDPKDNNTVYAAALGHLYSENEERGVFKTTDGGKTWEKILYISPKTGTIDLAIHPQNNRVLYAAAWEKERKPWEMIEGGEESAIYKTIDGGKTWQKKMAGFPQGDYVGRIGLAVSASNPDVIYALLDNRQPLPAAKPAAPGETSALSLDRLMQMSAEELIRIDNRALDKFLKETMAAAIFDAAMVKGLVKAGEITPQELAEVIAEDLDKLNLMVVGAEVYRSSDGGETWTKTHDTPLGSEIYKTYGFYFGQVRVDPRDENTIYVLGIPVLKSSDGGRTFVDISKQEHMFTRDAVHVDSHAMWIDPKDPRRILLGTDGGLNISYDAGSAWQKIENLLLAQCYTVNYDLHKPYYIYTGLQDNGVQMGPRNFRFGSSGRIWRMLLGADGASVEVQKDNPDIVYAASQFGVIFRLDLNKTTLKDIRPRPETKKSRYRFSWLAPFMISNHNSSTIYMGANLLFKSGDRGDHWEIISPDLSRKKNTGGDVPYATITTIDESPFTPEILYAGTDDGDVWVTQNGGQNWKNIGSVLPDKWVSRVIASQHKKERVYVTMSGYKEDDFTAYVYVSHDFGINWMSLQSNLPDEPVNVIREDPQNENILYSGTDLGVFVSLDMGETWHSLDGTLPTIAVCDLRVHPQGELIIGTHGRGVFVLPVKNIRESTAKVLAGNLYIFEIEPLQSVRGFWGSGQKIKFEFYSAKSTPLVLQVKKEGRTIKRFDLNAVPGINIFEWNGTLDEAPDTKAGPGGYQVFISAAGAKAERSFSILE